MDPQTPPTERLKLISVQVTVGEHDYALVGGDRIALIIEENARLRQENERLKAMLGEAQPRA